MHEKYAGNSIAIDSCIIATLLLGQLDKAEQKKKVTSQKHRASGPPPFFPDRTENEIGALFRDKIEFSLRPLQIAFSPETAAANRNLRLVHVISCAMDILLLA